MDPLSGLSVASNIVQFIDFGLKVVTKGRKIYRSVDGTLAENSDLEVVTSDLLILQSKLQCLPPISNKDGVGMDDTEAFKKLSNSCAELAGKLLQKLNMAKAQGRFRKWKSLRQALKSVWSKGEIEEMASRLSGFRGELQLHLLMTLRGQIDLSALEHSRLSTKLDQTALRILQALKDNEDVFDASLMSHTDRLSSRFDESDALIRKTGDDLRNTPSASAREPEWSHIAGLARKDVSSAILAGLTFPGMIDRYERVVAAHATTFSWIFEPNHRPDQPWDSFIEWLSQNGEIYWINGKAASGKSTLMRYIYDHPSGLKSYLKLWSGRKRLIMPKFYFWNTGTSLQKSQIGLLRSLLCEIFEKDLSLIRIADPELVEWTASQPMDRLRKLQQSPSWRQWSLDELKRMFLKLIESTSTTTMYCFFIDGLDEFDGDYLELAAFIKLLSKYPNVKVCVSSRPILAYEQFDLYPKLQLQDLTGEDITRFVRDRLTAHPHFSILAQDDPLKAKDLIDEIVRTSSGVFLWVSLVVKSILNGFTNHDRISDLRRRLRELPPELDDLYGLMLSSVTPTFYLEQASRLLQCVYQSPVPLTALELSFADDEDDLLAKVESKPFRPMEVERRSRDIEYRLKSRCAGLLEVRKSYDEEYRHWTIEYLHLTVKEFIEKPDVWTRLLNLTSSTGFDASLALLRTRILLIKSQLYNWDENTWSMVEKSMDLALQAENSPCIPYVSTIEELDRVVSNIESSKSGTRGPHWSTYLHSSDQQCFRCPKSFLAYAISNGLTSFAKWKIEKLPKTSHEKELLDYATWYRPWYISKRNTRPAMVAMLLQAGYDPNGRTHGSTPWRSLIKCIARTLDIKNLHPQHGIEFAHRINLDLSLVDVCKLFVLWGADVEADYRTKDGCRTAWEVFDAAFAHLPREPVLELKRLLLERGASLFTEPRPSPQRSSRHNPKDRRQLEGHGTNAQRHYHQRKEGRRLYNSDHDYLSQETNPRYRPRRHKDNVYDQRRIQDSTPQPRVVVSSPRLPSGCEVPDAARSAGRSRHWRPY